jgi:hypothetical protein
MWTPDGRTAQRRPRQQDLGAAPAHLRGRASARCVIHTHSTHLVALTLQGVWSEHDILPPITPYFVMKVGHVPLVPTTARATRQWLTWWRRASRRWPGRGTPIRAVLLDRLGPNVWQRQPRRGHGHAGRAGRDRETVADDPARARSRWMEQQIDELRQHLRRRLVRAVSRRRAAAWAGM